MEEIRYDIKRSRGDIAAERKRRKRIRRKRRLRRLGAAGKLLFLVLLLTAVWKYLRPVCAWIYHVKTGGVFAAASDVLAGDSEADEEDICLVLQNMAKNDSRAAFLLEHEAEYPREILKLASENAETLDFAADYLEKKAVPCTDSIGEVTKGTIPFLLQWDERWGYGAYGNGVIGINGCGPTCLAMVAAGLTGDDRLTPARVAAFAEENGYYVEGVGTKWTLMSEGAPAFGIQGQEMNPGKDAVMNSLEGGNPVICSMRPGDFTTTGHFIVLAGTENGKIIVYDPNSIDRSSRLWDYETLEYQINNLWKFFLLPL